MRKWVIGVALALFVIAGLPAFASATPEKGDPASQVVKGKKAKKAKKHLKKHGKKHHKSVKKHKKGKKHVKKLVKKHHKHVKKAHKK